MDEQFINKIKGVKVDWDKEALWEELEPKLPRHKRKFPWLMFLLGLVLVMAIYYGGKAFVITEEVPVTSLEVPAIEDKLVASPASESLIEPSSSTTSVLVQSQSSEKKGEQQLAGLNKNSNTPAVRKQETPLAVTENVQKNTAKAIQRRNRSIQPLSASAENNQTSTVTEANTGNEKLDDALTKAITFLPNPLMATATADQQTKDQGDVLLVEGETLKKKLLSEQPSLEDQFSEPNPKFSSQDHWQPADNINGLPALLLTEVSSLEKTSLAVGEIVLPAQANGRPMVVTKNNGLYLELAAGLGGLERTTSTDSISGVVSDVLLENKTYELPKFVLAANLGVGYQLENGLFFRSGINYRERHEQLNWKGELEIDSIKVENDRAYYSLSPLGDTTFYSSESDVLKRSQRQVKHWNRLRSYELPLVIGYVKQKDKFNLRASLGMTLNLSQAFQGRVVDRYDHIVENPAIIVSKKLGYLAGLGVGYQIGGRHQLFLDATCRISPTYEMLAIQQRYTSLNVLIGVRTFLGR